MRIAFISDIHGNLPALEEVLADIERRDIDKIFCTGDTINPFQESKEVLELLESKKIPILRGNHEDYIINYFFDGKRSRWEASNFRPIALVAEHLGIEVAKKFQELPLAISIRGPKGNNIFACHASPFSNTKSFYDGIDDEMYNCLEKLNENTVVSGHRHVLWHKNWQNKQLVSFGSVGNPMNGAPRAEYLLLEHVRDIWQHEFISLDYDNHETLRRYRESGYFHKGGPIAWMLYDEVLTGQRRLSTFFFDFLTPNHKLETENDWKNVVVEFLQQVGSWDKLKVILN